MLSKGEVEMGLIIFPPSPAINFKISTLACFVGRFQVQQLRDHQPYVREERGQRVGVDCRREG